MDGLDGVTRLQSVSLYQYTPDTNLKAITLQDGFDGGLFTLDSDSQVYYHATDESYMELSGDPSEIVFSGKALGSHVVGNVVDLMWRPTGTAVTRAGLGMLDANGALLTFHPDKVDTSVAPWAWPAFGSCPPPYPPLMNGFIY
ncbi:MAG: hypothetical protein M5U34_39015 [Chloroflexi bacterium]|nr:hypothetical protein [Chloroflexota bacterium]